MDDHVEHLASYQRGLQRIRGGWPDFARKRKDRLGQQERYGSAAEKVAENILEDLFTEVLDWAVSDLNNQIRYADLLLTRLGIKHLLVEVKRPGALAWNRRAVDAALDQATRYASEQKVRCVAVSDGIMLYAADIQNGGLRDRVFVSLDSADAPEALWWLSVHGIYRMPHVAQGQLTSVAVNCADPSVECASEVLLHHKYKLPAHCFAYIGDASRPETWKLPYRLASGSADLKRLPKAIQAILTNYRGARVEAIPEKAVADVLVRLACAAVAAGRMPHQGATTAPVYEQLAEALNQLGRTADVQESPITAA